MDSQLWLKAARWLVDQQSPPAQAQSHLGSRESWEDSDRRQSVPEPVLVLRLMRFLSLRL
jgi:hypothetical protein